MWWTALIPMFDRVVDRILPDNMSEKERADAKLKMRAQMLQEASADREEMKNAREMAMKEMESDVWLVRLLRGLIRPVTGFTFVTFYVWSKVCIHFGYEAIILSERDYFILGGILAFYFGMRSFLDKKDK